MARAPIRRSGATRYRVGMYAAIPARRSQEELRQTLLGLQRKMRTGVTLAEVKKMYGVGRSRAFEMMNQAAAMAGHKVMKEGKRGALKYLCPDLNPLKIELEESEVLSSLIILRDAAWPLFGSAFGVAKKIGPRLADALDRPTQDRVNALAQRVRLRFHPTRADSGDAFETIINAMGAGCTVRFDYAKGEDTPTLKSDTDRAKLMKPWHAEPWGMFYARRHLYVIVRPIEPKPSVPAVRDRYSSLRTIKLNRMREPRVTGTSFKVPKWFTLDGYLDDAWDFVRFGAAPKSKVVIDLDARAAENLIDTEWHRSQRIERNADGSVKLTPEGKVRITFHVRGFDEIKYWVLQLGRFARVVKPDGLRKAVLKELELMRDSHSEKPAARVGSP